jgi:hypothetical protein
MQNKPTNRGGRIHGAMNPYSNSSSSHQFSQKQMHQLPSSPHHHQCEGSPASVLGKEAGNSKNYNGKQIHKQSPEKNKTKATVYKDIHEGQRDLMKPERKCSSGNGIMTNMTSRVGGTHRSARAVQSPNPDSKSARGVQTVSSPRANQKAKRKISFPEAELGEESHSEVKTNANSNHCCNSPKDQIMQEKLDANFTDPTIDTKNVGESPQHSSPFSNINKSPAEPARSSTSQLPTNVKTKCILRGDSGPCHDAVLNLLAKEVTIKCKVQRLINLFYYRFYDLTEF